MLVAACIVYQSDLDILLIGSGSVARLHYKCYKDLIRGILTGSY